MSEQGLDDRGILTVSELTAIIRAALEDTFPAVWVRGEISNFAIPASGHYYFSLKDAAAQLRAVCFRSSHRRVPFTPRNGMEVIARGRISMYEPRGDLQIIVEEMVDFGLGNLMRAFEQLKEKLAAEGLFDEARKRRLPLFPARVGVVTSATGAAVRDILHILRRRNSAVHVLLYPVKVQGEGAADEIAEALRWFDAHPETADVLIVGRGGGSLEDLWPFNTEPVARAIAACRVPVISAVGHEVDFTIADFVADLRAPTPSAAAELVAAAAEHLRDRVAAARHAMAVTLRQAVAERRHRLRVLLLSRGVTALPHLVGTRIQRVDELAVQLRLRIRERLGGAERRLADARRRLETRSPVQRLRETAHRTVLAGRGLAARMQAILVAHRGRLDLAWRRLEAVGPRSVLARGYALCLDAGGRPVRTWQQAPPGSRVNVLLGAGRLGCAVETSRPDATDPDDGGTQD